MEDKDQGNLFKRKLSRNEQRKYKKYREAKLRGEDVAPVVFPKVIPLEQQPLKGNGHMWTERAR